MGLEWNWFCIVQAIHNYLREDAHTGYCSCQESSNAHHPEI